MHQRCRSALKELGDNVKHYELHRQTVSHVRGLLLFCSTCGSFSARPGQQSSITSWNVACETTPQLRLKLEIVLRQGYKLEVTLKFQTHSEERERHTHSSRNKLLLQRSYPLYIYMHLFMARVPIDGTTLYTRSLTFKKLWSLYYITCPSPRGSYCHHRSVSRLPIFPIMEIFYCFHSADTSAMLDPFVTFLLNLQ